MRSQSILIAGCGTSQAAKHALRWPQAQVTGIDFSATSVRRTEDLKRKYNLKNLLVRKLAIERLSELETSFDQVVCTGVLHHLEDPDAGLAALRSVLKPDGAMHLMVQKLGLAEAIDERVQLLKRHLPYHESDPCAEPGLQRAA